MELAFTSLEESIAPLLAKDASEDSKNLESLVKFLEEIRGLNSDLPPFEIPAGVEEEQYIEGEPKEEHALDSSGLGEQGMKESTEESHNKLYWIVPVVVGSILAIGLIIYFMKGKKTNTGIYPEV